MNKTLDGPALYRCSFQVPASRVGRGRLMLEFGAASFWALIRVNSVQVDVHQGAWSPFQVDISRWVHAGENSLEVEVWKPGRRFKLRETLSGFLPDVATAFGGLWQGVRLLAQDASFGDLRVLAGPDSRLEVSGIIVGLDLARPTDIGVEVNPGNAVARAIRVKPDSQTGRFMAELNLSGLARWQPAAPASAFCGGQCLAGWHVPRARHAPDWTARYRSTRGWHLD